MTYQDITIGADMGRLLGRPTLAPEPFDVKASTRKTKDGYYQPVLIVEGTVKHSPKQHPCLTRETAQRQAEHWRKESLLCGYVTYIG